MNINHAIESSNGRIISDVGDFDSNENRGVNFHGSFAKFWVDIFGSGTIDTVINNKHYYLNKGSCYKLVKKAGDQTVNKDDFLALKDDEIIRQIQNVFNKLHPEPVIVPDEPHLGEWLTKYKDDFLAHATRNTKVILDLGFLKPAEMIFREGVKTEFEKGRFAGERGESTMPELTNEELRLLGNTLFSDEDAIQLENLSHDKDSIDRGRIQYKQYAAWRKTQLYKFHPSEAYQNTFGFSSELNEWDSIEVLGVFHRKSNQDLQNYLAFSYLKRKQAGLRALFSYGKKREMWDLPDAHYEAIGKYKDRVSELAIQYNCGEREVIIAFDQTRGKEKRLDTYLRRKFQKGTHKLDKLEDTRQKFLKIDKLASEIRMQANGIRWGYGPVVILKSRENTAVWFTDDRHEAYLQSTISGDDFYSINLKESDDLLILGPKAQLEPFKAEYGNKIVYIEDLSLEQREFLKVPKRL